MARQVTGQVPGRAGTSDGAQAGPRALSWAEESSWALDGGGMEVGRGHYGLFVVLSGPWDFGVQTGVTHHSIPDWLRLSGTSGDHLVQMESRVQTRSGTHAVRPRCRWGTRGSEAPGRNAGAAPAGPCWGQGGQLHPHPHGTVPPTGPSPACLWQEIAQTHVDSESSCSCFILMLPTADSWSPSCSES